MMIVLREIVPQIQNIVHGLQIKALLDLSERCIDEVGGGRQKDQAVHFGSQL